MCSNFQYYFQRFKCLTCGVWRRYWQELTPNSDGRVLCTITEPAAHVWGAVESWGWWWQWAWWGPVSTRGKRHVRLALAGLSVGLPTPEFCFGVDGMSFSILCFAFCVLSAFGGKKSNEDMASCLPCHLLHITTTHDHTPSTSSPSSCRAFLSGIVAYGTKMIPIYHYFYQYFVLFFLTHLPCK